MNLSLGSNDFILAGRGDDNIDSGADQDFVHGGLGKDICSPARHSFLRETIVIDHQHYSTGLSER